MSEDNQAVGNLACVQVDTSFFFFFNPTVAFNRETLEVS